VSLRSRRVVGYEGARLDVQELVPLEVRQILDLGCSSGLLGAALKARQKVTITGVELDDVYAKDAVSRIDRVLHMSVEDFIEHNPMKGVFFDCLIAADILEHLVDPWDVLSKAVEMLAPDATVIVSLPNVLYWPEFRRLLIQRRWPRDDVGIFDRTHLRWFTRADAIELVEQAGLSLVRVVPSYWACGLRLVLHRAMAKTPLRPFAAAQYLVVSRLTRPQGVKRSSQTVSVPTRQLDP
jgi:SAM-dependent methyltransferase